MLSSPFTSVCFNLRSFILSLSVNLLFFAPLFILSFKPQHPEEKELVIVHLRDLTYFIKEDQRSRDNQAKGHRVRRPIPQGPTNEKALISKAEPPFKEGFKEVIWEAHASLEAKEEGDEALNRANKEGVFLGLASEGVSKSPSTASHALKEGAETKGSEASGKVEEAQFSIISKLVREHLEYPYLARRMNWEGEVLLFFKLNPAGEVEEIKVLKSSGFEVLDKHAVNAVKRASKHFPRPKHMVLIKLPIQFKLEGGGI